MFGIKTSTVDAIADTPGVQQILRKLRSRQHVFERCYSQRLWGSAESGSGCGSEIAATDDLRSYLPDLVGRLGVKLVLDAPCGDWNWMRLVDFGEVEYIGADIVPSVIDDNQSRYARPGVRFILADLAKDPLPQSDLILCRDCWVHLSFQDIAAMLENFRRSGATWLLVSDTPSAGRNLNKFTGASWRHLNLSLAPFHFPPPLDRQKDHHADVPFQISLWRITDLPSIE
jgi:hypothetical protein